MVLKTSSSQTSPPSTVAKALNTWPHHRVYCPCWHTKALFRVVSHLSGEDNLYTSPHGVGGVPTDSPVVWPETTRLQGTGHGNKSGITLLLSPSPHPCKFIPDSQVGYTALELLELVCCWEDWGFFFNTWMLSLGTMQASECLKSLVFFFFFCNVYLFLPL